MLPYTSSNIIRPCACSQSALRRTSEASAVSPVELGAERLRQCERHRRVRFHAADRLRAQAIHNVAAYAGWAALTYRGNGGSAGDEGSISRWHGNASVVGE